MANSIFKFRYFYDNERGQLGIYGLPTCAYPLFDGTVYFQNSCDQDYARSEYKGIKIFEDIYDKWVNTTEEEFGKMYEKHFGKKFDREYMDEVDFGTKLYDERLLYVKRSAVYDVIWDPIEPTLYDDSKSLYLCLVGNYDITICRSFIALCHREQMAYEEEMRKEFPEDFKENAEVGNTVLDDEAR